MENIDQLERKIFRVENLLIYFSLVLIATTDYLIGKEFSLGPLYLIPLCYSAMTNGIKVTLILLAVCIALRQVSGPLQHLEFPFESFVMDIVIASIFITSTYFLQKLGKERTLFFNLAKSQRDELNHEIELAADVQKNLIKLNDIPPPKMDIYANTTQLKTVGGDFYDYFMIADHVMVATIADISGKGVPAALLMPAVKLAIRTITSTDKQPDQVLKELNTLLFRLTESRHYVTLVLVYLDFSNKTLTCVNAGHPPPVLFADNSKGIKLEKGGLPAGMLSESTYESEQIGFTDNETLIMYSDGITEVRNHEKEEYGVARIIELAAHNRHMNSSELAKTIERDATKFAGNAELKDDKSLFVIQYH